MTNDKAIERIKAFRDYLCGGNPIWDVGECREAFDIALAAMEQKWIPVSERLPNQNERFLVQYEDGGIDVARCSDVNPFWTNLKTDWHWVGTVQFAEVVAWMPLPEPWRGEEV